MPEFGESDGLRFTARVPICHGHNVFEELLTNEELLIEPSKPIFSPFSTAVQNPNVYQLRSIGCGCAMCGIAANIL